MTPHVGGLGEGVRDETDGTGRGGMGKGGEGTGGRGGTEQAVKEGAGQASWEVAGEGVEILRSSGN